MSGRGRRQHKYITKQSSNIINQKKPAHSSAPGFSGDDPLATIRLPERSVSSQSLDKY